MEKVIINSYEEFEKLVGQQIGVSDYVELSQERINLFADATLDHQWIHVDTERAKVDSPYHSTIAHGYLTLSMLPYLWNQIIQVNNLKMMINYGMDKMKFGQAVLSGQSIRLVTTLHSLTNLRGVAKAEIKFAIEIKDQPNKLPFNRDNYAIGFDYVIKRYLTECYELRNNPKSKYYKSKYGKPALVVLCTHWNDNRTLYNTSVRLLAEKWGFPLVEFDKYIGFSKRANHPVTNEPVTLLYASDMQKIEGVLHGHHPLRGENEYIQRKMAAIFVDMMHKVLPVK